MICLKTLNIRIITLMKIKFYLPDLRDAFEEQKAASQSFASIFSGIVIY